MATMWLAASAAAAILAVVSHLAHQKHRDSKEWHHSLHRKPRPRMTYAAKDFLDYVFMVALTSVAIAFTFGEIAPLAVRLCHCCSVVLVVSFPIRNGWAVTTSLPLFLRQPHEILFCVITKLGNIRPTVLIAIAVTCLEQWAIVRFPDLPHNVEWYENICSLAFLTSFYTITAFRIVLLLHHTWKQAHVFDFLGSTGWRKILGEHPNAAQRAVHLTHAFATGLLCHVAALVPLYLVLTCFRHSVALMPLRLAVDSLCLTWFWKKEFGHWLYRDHWVCLHHEAAFVCVRTRVLW